MKLKLALATSLLIVGSSAAQADATSVPSILASVSSDSIEKLSDTDAAKTRGEYITCWSNYYRGSRVSGLRGVSGPQYKGRSRGNRGRGNRAVRGGGARPSQASIMRAVNSRGTRGARGARGSTVSVGGGYNCYKSATLHPLSTGPLGYNGFRFLAGTGHVAGWKVYVSR